ncbi:hypothetical protein [Oscillatoria acuminata]|nr:hypothetical protein [Oscillatoria acuminata]
MAQCSPGTKTLSELIWEITCPDEDPPEPATPAELRSPPQNPKTR